MTAEEWAKHRYWLKSEEDSDYGRAINAAVVRVEELENELDSSNGCLAMIADRLTKLGCCCNPASHAATPPMMYDDWIACAVKKHQMRVAELEAENARLRAACLRIAEGTCSYDGCQQPAVTVALGREGYETDGGHPELNVYCQVHADGVSEEGSPEYTETCPNCGCQFGVN